MTSSLATRQLDIGALVLRGALGVMWLSHSVVLKMMTFGMAGLAQWLPTVGFGSALAYPLTIAEIAGGVAILVGAGGRWASLALVPVLIGATAVHAGNGWVFTNSGGGWEYPVFLLAASLAHVALGDGAFALSRARTQRSAAPACAH